jgi:hypothetical protein
LEVLPLNTQSLLHRFGEAMCVVVMVLLLQFSINPAWANELDPAAWAIVTGEVSGIISLDDAALVADSGIGSPLSPLELLRELRQHGVEVALKDNKISCRPGGDALTPELRAQWRQRIRLVTPKAHRVRAVYEGRSVFRPKTMTLVLHNRTGLNRFGQDAATHPFALMSERAWDEADWNLADCRWYGSAGETNGYRPPGAAQAPESHRRSQRRTHPQ